MMEKLEDILTRFGNKIASASRQEKAGQNVLPFSDTAHKVLPPTVRRSLVRARPTDDQTELCFQHSVFCQTGLPYRDPKDAREWDRQNGIAALHIDAGFLFNPRTHKYEPIPLPWGPKPRLILAHLNAEALRAGSPTIEIADSLSAFVRRIRGFAGRREITMFKEQLKRLATAIIRLAIVTDEQDGQNSRQTNTPLVSGFNLWFPKDERQRVLWNSTVRLSQEYFDDLKKHAVPLHEAALAALAHTAMGLDVYAWLAQRLHRIDPHRPTFIPWTLLKEQFGFEYGQMFNFKREFRHTLAKVLARYPAARVELDNRGMTARNSPPPVAKRLVLIDHR
jgi:Plasmid encoded RepA protein